MLTGAPVLLILDLVFLLLTVISVLPFGHAGILIMTIIALVLAIFGSPWVSSRL